MAIKHTFFFMICKNYKIYCNFKPKYISPIRRDSLTPAELRHPCLIDRNSMFEFLFMHSNKVRVAKNGGRFVTGAQLC